MIFTTYSKMQTTNIFLISNIFNKVSKIILQYGHLMSHKLVGSTNGNSMYINIYSFKITTRNQVGFPQKAQPKTQHGSKPLFRVQWFVIFNCLICIQYMICILNILNLQPGQVVI